MTKTQSKNLAELEEQSGLNFDDKDLLRLAFIHKSFVNEHENETKCNERLEFLGDAVLELVVTDFLFKVYPKEPEGALTNWRSALVKGRNLAKVAQQLQLGDYLLLSRGEDLSGGREKDYILANTTEAFIGAIYLDKGYNDASKFIKDHIIVLLEEIISQGLHIDAKSRVQELAQEKFSCTPRYEMLEDSGPDHDKVFVMGIYFGKNLVGKGGGPSKQEAEQAAAHEALKAHNWV
ncbi:ribonuclease III [Candidatus Peregrinibacteria bacterium]|jgi:ribonuclease III|nr:ribonuclease III [Candidatus Peregrinibacteria bacterium]MBT4631365.1 ribonuclease III [Candidatus Peregrinibacteria bacterium]MBT5517178.1 ribonuclease III [Candidatus Peregrinibacteria bacterium]MBT5823760.1 ribonuclease III [Candidatus Peregrinibacteria bacterium]